MAYDLKIFTEDIDPEATHLVYELIGEAPFAGSKVRIMPDVHYGKGCVVGFTATVGDKIIPNVIGVDIGCGMLTAELKDIDVDLAALDNFIKENIPCGSRVRKEVLAESLIDRLRCRSQLGDPLRLYGSLGTLGGGNHFIEMDVDDEGNKYLIIHSGSRNLGLQVAKFYQKLAVERCKGAAEEERSAAIKALKDDPARIPDAIRDINRKYAHLTKIPAEMCYLEGAAMEDYLHDVKLCTEFASLNRKKMCEEIVRFLGVRRYTVFETIHNYIGEDNVVRKGAISAQRGERVIIPMNMRDGCLIAVGKGNEDWNNSAPHGAGRLLKRSEVKELFTVEEFRSEMEGIYTTTVGASTLDESPMAYKPMQEIVSRIGPTVDIERIIKPIYNFKAGDL